MSNNNTDTSNNGNWQNSNNDPYNNSNLSEPLSDSRNQIQRKPTGPVQ